MKRKYKIPFNFDGDKAMEVFRINDPDGFEAWEQAVQAISAATGRLKVR